MILKTVVFGIERTHHKAIQRPKGKSFSNVLGEYDFFDEKVKDSVGLSLLQKTILFKNE